MVIEGKPFQGQNPPAARRAGAQSANWRGKAGVNCRLLLRFRAGKGEPFPGFKARIGEFFFLGLKFTVWFDIRLGTVTLGSGLGLDCGSGLCLRAVELVPATGRHTSRAGQTRLHLL